MSYLTVLTRNPLPTDFGLDQDRDIDLETGMPRDWCANPSNGNANHEAKKMFQEVRSLDTGECPNLQSSLSEELVLQEHVDQFFNYLSQKKLITEEEFNKIVIVKVAPLKKGNVTIVIEPNEGNEFEFYLEKYYLLLKIYEDKEYQDHLKAFCRKLKKWLTK